MRYTTIIDLTEYPRLYANVNVRLVYLHMCLRAGYHDEDRDAVRESIRALAADTGLTVAAIRHALAVLKKENLTYSVGGRLYVRKWCAPASISKRKAEPTTKNPTPTREAVVDKPRTEDEWRKNRMEVLRTMVEKVNANPRSVMRAALMEAYSKGELETYGIEWKPKKEREREGK